MKNLDEENLIRYIMLTQMKGLGPVTQNALLDACGYIDRCFEMGHEAFYNTDVAKKAGAKRINLFLLQRDETNLRIMAERILADCLKKGISIVTRESISFPDRFRNFPDMPILLYHKGELRINEYAQSDGVVGARRCSVEGKKCAIDIALEAARSGNAIVSGMAKGIDSYAHTAAIKSGGYTIAVLGNGVDICYPNEHEKLYEEIASHGCILSEYPPGTKPKEYYFPKRNRLIAALSDRIYVVDAGRKSGTETTVENGKRYGRVIVVVHEAYA